MDPADGESGIGRSAPTPTHRTGTPVLPDDEEWLIKERACSHIGISGRTFNRYIDAGVLAVNVNGTVFVQRLVPGRVPTTTHRRITSGVVELARSVLVMGTT